MTWVTGKLLCSSNHNCNVLWNLKSQTTQSLPGAGPLMLAQLSSREVWQDALTSSSCVTQYKNPKKKLSTLSEFIMFLFAVMVCGRFVEIEMQDEGWTFWFILFLIFWGQQIEQPLSSSNIMPGRMLASPKPLLFKESNSSQALLDVQFHKSKEKCFDVDVRTECV